MTDTKDTQLHERRYAIKGKSSNGNQALMYVSTEVMPETIHITTNNGNHLFIPYLELKKVLNDIESFKGIDHE